MQNPERNLYIATLTQAMTDYGQIYSGRKPTHNYQLERESAFKWVNEMTGTFPEVAAAIGMDQYSLREKVLRVFSQIDEAKQPARVLARHKEEQLNGMEYNSLSISEEPNTHAIEVSI
jgi:hypothetical protein